MVERSSPSNSLQKICQICKLCFLQAMLAALARCIASSALSSLRAFCSTLARSFLKAQKKTSCPCLCSSRAEIWERMRSFRRVLWICAGVFSPSCVKRDIILTNKFNKSENWEHCSTDHVWLFNKGKQLRKVPYPLVIKDLSHLLRLLPFDSLSLFIQWC